MNARLKAFFERRIAIERDKYRRYNLTRMTTQMKRLEIPVADGCVVTVPYPISEEDYELLIKTLELWKSRLTRNPSAPAGDYFQVL